MQLRLASTVALFALLIAPAASAQSGDARLAYLTRQLKQAKDARVRAQSAIVLGQMEEPSVVASLCEALADESDVVRSASAKALEQIGELDSLGCLKKYAKDSNASSREAIARAIRTLEEWKNRKPVFYVSLKRLKVSDVELDGKLLELAEQKLKKQLDRKGALFAPENESKTAAKGVLKKKGLKGFLLMPEIQGEGSNGLRIRMLCLTYPEQSILGEVNVKAAGGKPADLIRALAPRVVDEAAAIIESTED